MQNIVSRVSRKLTYLFSKRRYLELALKEVDCSALDIRNPRSFNEKLNAYKIDSFGTRMMPRLVDKIGAKKYIASKIGREYEIPTIWHGPKLPPREQRTWTPPYVLKSSHGCGQNIFVRDEPDWDLIEAKTANWLTMSHGLGLLEWPYLRVQPEFLVEPCIVSGDELPVDYKFFVFDGKARMIQVDEGRACHHRRTLMNTDWKPFDFAFNVPRPATLPERPIGLTKMIELAEILAAKLPFVRVDLYNLDGRILFGEMTFFPAAGTGRFDPPEADFAVGEWWPYEPRAIRQAAKGSR